MLHRVSRATVAALLAIVLAAAPARATNVAGDGEDRIDGGSGVDGCHDTDQPGPFPRCEP